MKLNIILIYSLILVFFLTWNNKIDNQLSKNYDNWDNATIIKNYFIPEWYTWAISIVTDDNIKEPIYQTWEQLLYINKALWFQVLLWEERNWAKIWWTDKSIFEDAIYEIVFALPNTRYSDKFVKDGSYFNTISIWVIDANKPGILDSYSNMWINRDSENIIINEENGLIYYIFFTFDEDEIQKLFPSSKCSENMWNCPYLVDSIFSNWFKTFNI